jgi:predicted DNA-binding protein with PD1-like motif
MSEYHEIVQSRTFMGRLPLDGDLLESLTEVAKTHNVKLGWVQALGAVRKAKLGYYDQSTREYGFTEYDEPMEICNLVGNVSLKDGEPICHIHVTLSREDGTCVGGHLAPGTVIFACEFKMTELEGPEYVRGFDEPTGLPLWEL